MPRTEDTGTREVKLFAQRYTEVGGREVGGKPRIMGWLGPITEDQIQSPHLFTP